MKNKNTTHLIYHKINCKKDEYGIPYMLKQDINLENLKVCSFKHINKSLPNSIAHMFLYDDVLERTYKNPENMLKTKKC
ncbi:MAG: hypothetical protein LBH55_01610 [Mycoplasmataceae bacterium]|jgi:hypothetical protein|nr:hypothetical protein [Mycoplasmataceae bacterium]